MNGRDLMQIGIEAGPGMKQILAQLLDLVLCEQLPNEKKSLLEHTKAMHLCAAGENA